MTAPSSRTGATDREVEYLASMDRYAAAKVWRSTLESVTFGEYEAFCDGWDAARAAAAPDSDQRIAAVLTLHVERDADGLNWCRECEREWPCSTVRALTSPAALLAEQPGGGQSAVWTVADRDDEANRDR